MPQPPPNFLIVNNYARNPSRITELYQAVKTVTGFPPIIAWYRELLYLDLQRFDGLILSGSEAMLSEHPTQQEFAPTMSTLRRCRKPILGICYGHQLLGATFGGTVIRLPQKIEGFHPVTLLNQDPLFDELPRSFQAAQSHSEVVESLMPDFHHLARAEAYPIEAFRHRSRPIWGVQFHPERTTEEHPFGRKILLNFTRIVADSREPR